MVAVRVKSAKGYMESKIKLSEGTWRTAEEGGKEKISIKMYGG